jgi:hypothetical protein
MSQKSTNETTKQRNNETAQQRNNEIGNRLELSQ